MDNTEIERIEIDVETQQAIKQLKKFQKAYESSINSSKIQQNAVKAANSINKSLKTTTQAASKTVKGISNMANKTVSAIKSTVNKTTKSITNALKKSINTAKKLGMQFGKTFAKTIANTITKGIKGLMKVFKTLTRTLMKSIASVIKGSSNLIGKAFKGVFNGVNKLVSSSIRGIINTARKSLQGFSNLLDEVLEEKKLELEVNATAGSKGGSKQKSSGGSGMAGALMNAGLISSSLKTMTKAIASNNIGGLNGDIVAKFASKMIDAGQKTLAFGSFVYKAYRLFKQYWPNILDAFGKISEKVSPILKRGFKLVTEAVGQLLSKGMTIVANKMVEIPAKVLPLVKNGFMKLINSAGNIFQKGIDAMINSNNPKIRAIGVLLQFITDLMKKLSPVLMSVVDGCAQFIDVIAELIGEIDFSSIAGTLSDVLSQLVTSIKAIASYFTPYLSETVKELVNIFGKAGKFLISVFKSIEKVGNILSPLGKIVAPLINLFGNLIDIGTVFGNSLSGSLDNLSPALSNFVNLVTSHLISDITNVSNALKGIAGKLPNILDTFNKAITPAIEKLLNSFGGLIDTLFEARDKLFGAFKKGLIDAGINLSLEAKFKRLSDITGTVVETFSVLIDAISAFVEDLANSASTYLTPVVRDVATVFKWFGEKVTVFTKEFVSTMQANSQNLNKAFKGLIDRVLGLGYNLWSSLKEVAAHFINVFGLTSDNIGKAGNKLASFIANSLVSTFDILSYSFKNLSYLVETTLTPTLKFFVDILKWVYDRLKTFVKSFTGNINIGSNLKEVINAFAVNIKASVNLLKTFAEAIGKFLSALGITQLIDFLLKTLGKGIAKLVNFISKIVVGFLDLDTYIREKLTPIVEFLGDLLSILGTCIKEAIMAIPEMIKNFVESVKNFINKLKEKFPLLGKVIDGFVEVVKAVTWPFRKAIEVVTNWFKRLVTGMKNFFFWLRKNNEEEVATHVTQDQKLKAEKVSESKNTTDFNDTFKELYGTDVHSLLSEEVVRKLKADQQENSARSANALKAAIFSRYKYLEQTGEILEGLFDETGKSNFLGDELVKSVTRFKDTFDSAIPDYIRNLIPERDYYAMIVSEAKTLAKGGESIFDTLDGSAKEIEQKAVSMITDNIDSINRELDFAIANNKNAYDIRKVYEKLFPGKDLQKMFGQVSAGNGAEVFNELGESLEEIYKDIPGLIDRTKLVHAGIATTAKALKAYNEALVENRINSSSPKDAVFQAKYFEERMRVGIEEFLDPLTKSTIMDYMSDKGAIGAKQDAIDAIKKRKLDFNSFELTDMGANTFLVTIEKYLKAIESSDYAISRFKKEGQLFNSYLEDALKNTQSIVKPVEDIKTVVENIGKETNEIKNDTEQTISHTSDTSDLEARHKKIEELLAATKRNGEQTSAINAQTLKELEEMAKEAGDINFDNLKLPDDIQKTLDDFSSANMGFDDDALKTIQDTLDAFNSNIENQVNDIEIPDFTVGDAPKKGKGNRSNQPEYYKSNTKFKGFDSLDLDAIKGSLDDGLEKIVLDTVKDFEVDLSDAPEVTLKKFESTVYDKVKESISKIEGSVNKGIEEAIGTSSGEGLINKGQIDTAINNVLNTVNPAIQNATDEVKETLEEGLDVNGILSSIKESLAKEISSEPIQVTPIVTGAQNTTSNDTPKPTSEFSDYAKKLTAGFENAFEQTEEFNSNIGEMADTMQQQAVPAVEQIRIEIGRVNSETEKVKRNLSNAFKPNDYSGVLDGVLDGLEQTEQQAQQAGASVQQIFSDSEFSNMNSGIEETTESIKELKINLSGLDDSIDEVGESARQATENLAPEEEKDSFAKFFSEIKNGFKSTLDAVDAYVDMADDIDKVLHPVKALKKEINTKVTSSLFGTTTKQIKDLKDEFVVFRDQVKAFKESDLKGFDRLKAKLQLMGQQAKLQMKQMKLTFKTNAIGKLIQRMQGPVEKETRELAEKSPGGKENIGLFQGGLKKLALLFGGIGIGSIIKTSTQEAIGFESAMMLLNARLGESVSILNDFASTRGLELGLSKANIAEFGNIFSVYVSQFAKDTEEMANTTRDLLEAAAITAQSTGYTMTDVMESFRSGLTGSVEALDQYGINVKVAALESSAAFKEIANGAESWDQLTQAQQQQLISMNIVSQVHRNFGNGIRNTNTILLQFQAALANVRLALGNTFKVILSAVLPPLTVLMQALEVVLNKVTQFVTALLGLFGIEVSFDGLGGSGAGAGGLNDLGDSVGNIADSGDGVKDTADNISGVGDAAKDAADKASELNKQLLGIDELNTIQTRTDSNSGSGGSGGSGSGGSGLDSALGGLGGLGGLNSFDINPLEKTINESASRIAEVLRSIGDAFMEGWNRNLPYLQESLDRLEASFGRIKQAGKNLFKDIWENGKQNCRFKIPQIRRKSLFW